MFATAALYAHLHAFPACRHPGMWENRISRCGRCLPDLLFRASRFMPSPTTPNPRSVVAGLSVNSHLSLFCFAAFFFSALSGSGVISLADLRSSDFVRQMNAVGRLEMDPEVRWLPLHVRSARSGGGFVGIFSVQSSVLVLLL